MAAKHFPYYLNKYLVQGSTNLKINSSYNILSINVTQDNTPFSVELMINMTLNITDEFANISVTRTIKSSIMIDGIIDPLFAVNSINRVIKKSSINKAEGTWNYTDLEKLYLNEEYRSYSQGVSFVNRIKGNFSSSRMGIESFVNQSSVIYGKNLSMIDYFFWNKTYFNCSNKKLVRINSSLIPSLGLTDPQGLQIDDIHRLGFNISSSNAYVSSWC
jgi:hypothetical protein